MVAVAKPIYAVMTSSQLINLTHIKQIFASGHFSSYSSKSVGSLPLEDFLKVQPLSVTCLGREKVLTF